MLDPALLGLKADFFLLIGLFQSDNANMNMLASDCVIQVNAV